jgi:hypothetical protein
MKMDPITVILTALATGAAAGVTSTATDAIKEAYGALKSLVKARYATVGVDALEKQPASPALRREVKKELKNGAAGEDLELLRQARAVIDLVQEHAPQAAEVVGVTIAKLKAQSLYVRNIESSGTGVKVIGTTIKGDAVIEGVRAGPIRSKG